MHLLCLFHLLAVQGQIPTWEVEMGSIPMNGVLLADNAAGGMDLFVPMGDHGLGAWSGDGVPLSGFPVSADHGVTQRPAALDTPGHGPTLVYADDEGWIHRIDHDGDEIAGWPVFIGPNAVTGITVVDLDADGEPELAFGTADGRVHLLDPAGDEIPGWPVELPAQLQWQPTQLPLGGGAGHGLVCALVSSSVYALGIDGGVLPGWPVNTGFSAGSPPVTADIDSDGLGDVIFSTYDERVFAIRMSGSILQGWPADLGARTVAGAMAVGRLDQGAEGLQIAVSLMDSTVALVHGDGTSPREWRTQGRPTPPILARTAGGLGVLVGADDGKVYCWNVDGTPLQGYPFDFGQMITRPLAAGDIDGDGNLELVVLGRSGRLGAFTISSMGTDPGPWPQTLSDAGNSGSFARSLLPVMETGELTGELSGDVTVSCTVSGGASTGVSVAYSTNAGFTWQETWNYDDTGAGIVWHSGADLAGQDRYDCALKLTPLCREGSGVSGITNIFHVDNNRAPEIHLASPVELSPGVLTLAYAVDDPEGDVLQLQAQYSLDGGVSWSGTTLSGSTYEITRWYYGEPVTWSVPSSLRVDGAIPPGISLRVRAADDDTGPWYVLEDVLSAESGSPCAQVITPDGEVSGRVSLGLRLSDPACDPMSLRYEVSTDGGTTWRSATVPEAVVPYEGSDFLRIYWESETDLPGFEGIEVRLRTASPGGGWTGIPSAALHLDNNADPTIAVTSPQRGKTFYGQVPVSVQISDPEQGTVHVGLEYRLEGSDAWTTAIGFPALRCAPGSYTASGTWDSTRDLPEADGIEVDVRLTVYDGDLVHSDVIDGIRLENTCPPDAGRNLVTLVVCKLAGMID